MPATHHDEIEAVLREARDRHRALLEHVTPELRASLPVDAQGITEAIARLAAAVGAEDVALGQRRGHRTNAAVMHARVFGGAPLSDDTVVAAFVDGARVRADLLGRLAEAAGGAPLAEEIRGVLVAHPLPAEAAGDGAVDALRDAYAAQERAVLRVAEALDGRG